MVEIPYIGTEQNGVDEAFRAYVRIKGGTGAAFRTYLLDNVNQ